MLIGCWLLVCFIEAKGLPEGYKVNHLKIYSTGIPFEHDKTSVEKMMMERTKKKKTSGTSAGSKGAEIDKWRGPKEGAMVGCNSCKFDLRLILHSLDL